VTSSVFGFILRVEVRNGYWVKAQDCGLVVMSSELGVILHLEAPKDRTRILVIRHSF
jgi:hypothetical protein